MPPAAEMNGTYSLLSTYVLEQELEHLTALKVLFLLDPWLLASIFLPVGSLEPVGFITNGEHQTDSNYEFKRD
jgi:hypothetical protein